MTRQTYSAMTVPSDDFLLQRTLSAAGLPVTGSFVRKSGWMSCAWVGDEYIIRLSNGQARDSYRHEALVVQMLWGTDVPHSKHIAHGEGPDGPWYVSERLPGQTLHDVWPHADTETRRSIAESLGHAIRALHRIPVSNHLQPPWVYDALAGKPRFAYHPPVVGAANSLVEDAFRVPGHSSQLLAEVADWIAERLALFSGDEHVLVHGDLHGSNVMVDQGRVTGLIDFAEALTQPKDVELDTILRWCARSSDYPPTPDGVGLRAATLREVPGWIRMAYPELFNSDYLRERLMFYDMLRELALYAHHPMDTTRDATLVRITMILDDRNHLDGLEW